MRRLAARIFSGLVLSVVLTSCQDAVGAEIQQKEEEEDADSCLRPTNKEEAFSQAIAIGTLTPAPILVIQNFLNVTVVQRTWDHIASNAVEWNPVIPDHREAYRDLLVASKDDDVLQLFYAPTRPKHGGFPGLRTDLTVEYQEALGSKLESIRHELEAVFEEESYRPKRSLRLKWHTKDSFFGNLCYHPESLSLAQKLPHTDSGTVEQQPLQLALVHYLSPTWGHRAAHNNNTKTATSLAGGGTAFYAQAASGGASRFRRHPDCQLLQDLALEKGLKRGTTAYIKEASCHCRAGAGNMNCVDYLWYTQGIEKSGIVTKQAYYNGNSTDSFSSSLSANPYPLLYHVPYQFNTVVIYDAQQLHSAMIDDESLQHLQCYPTQKGRITANIFLV